MPLSSATATTLLNTIITNDLWLAMMTTYPSPDDSAAALTEPAAVDYARFPLDPAYWSLVSAGYAKWNFTITMLPENNWGDIAAYALVDTDSGDGTVMGYELLVSPVTISAGGVFHVDQGVLTCRVQ